MFTSNPFAALSASIPPAVMQAYVVLMIVLVAAGTLFDVVHKGSARYFFATWRKSRKLLHCNPLLGTLPRLSLQAPPPSLYAPLRKAQQPQHQRSTLEATALALQQLEGDVARYQPLLAAFEGFVDAQGEFAAQS